jgi:hypothetical protein
MYPMTASYINQNINIGTMDNCNNSFIGKVKINYENESMVQNITWSYNTDHYETSFIIDSKLKVPTSLEFLSNDESTVYIQKTITCSLGNYYLLKQKLRIE